MKKIPIVAFQFLKRQNFVIVMTIDEKGRPHASCKDIVKIEENGRIYLLDLYKAKTFENLRRNSALSITAVDEHSFKGFCLKGTAQEIFDKRLNFDIMELWDKKIASRATHRVIKNIRGEKGHSAHPETQLPRPKYIILMEVDEVVNLTPARFVS